MTSNGISNGGLASHGVVADGLVFLLYRSETDLKPGAVEVDNIIYVARRDNQHGGLTGYLHLEDGCFYQWLEGPGDALTALMGRICADQRHRNVKVLWQGQALSRQFPDWSMGFGIADPDTLFDWVSQRGVAGVDSAGFAREILAFMRAQAA
ncbi:MAG: BLUF domain-containing protein [Paracoccus sp. (in: a-proteobacteria)]|uniref:BLUF domain-containing protein n=1 Tax=Paracoccus sp. TaxID=267 RepID=UPI0026E0C652|nr:BLUF domain-containing protein [Paracoccus sp. (in: a-proteobacteria)]MDO5622082.1 BLUF domain-containing protein [Paracoccus sp. (in: a-proteobacteria)]